jgi:hypothetical protein
MQVVRTVGLDIAKSVFQVQPIPLSFCGRGLCHSAFTPLPLRITGDTREAAIGGTVWVL